jgi:hypothetical protein
MLCDVSVREIITPTYYPTIMYLSSGAPGAQPANVAAVTTELPGKWERAGLALKQRLQDIAALRYRVKQTPAVAELDSSQTRYVPKLHSVSREVGWWTLWYNSRFVVL